MEFKDSICAKSGVMLRMEIVEGKDSENNKKFLEPGMNKGTAMVKRLTEQWHGSGRCVVADSYFASVMTCIYLFKVGLFFTGIVKTCSKFFPKKWCKEVPMAERGDTMTATATKDGVKIIAHVWNDPGKEGKPRKALVSTMGTTLEADPAVRPRKRKSDLMGVWETVMKSVKRTALVKHYFKWAGAIDRHNRKRMDGLRMELTHEFKVWWKRIFTSFLAVIIVDALAAFVMEQGEVDQLEFYEELAKEMIWNDLEGVPVKEKPRKYGCGVSRQNWQSGKYLRLRPKKAAGGAPADSDADEEKPIVCNHHIQPLKSLPAYANAKNARLNCRVCGKNQATLYCVSCLQNPHGQILSLCSPGVSSSCLSLHCQTPV